MLDVVVFKEGFERGGAFVVCDLECGFQTTFNQLIEDGFMRNGIISVDCIAMSELSFFLMSLDNLLFPNFNCGGVGIFTLSFDTYEESSRCE